MVVVDTSVWVDFFRGANEAVSAPFRDLIRRGQVVLTGVVFAEVLQGIASPEQENWVENHLASLPYFETSKETWRKAASLSRELRRKGLTIPLTDLIVGALAIEHDVEVYTTDRHFQKIPGLKLYRPK